MRKKCCKWRRKRLDSLKPVGYNESNGIEGKKYAECGWQREPAVGGSGSSGLWKYIPEPRTEPPERRSKGAVRARYSAGALV